MSKEQAKKFFDQLEKDEALQGRIKQGLEKLAKENGYDATEDDLTVELRERWECEGPLKHPYSEPPGF
jgi:predicted ribosomally synthesized peptide with nif11-like leader